MAATWDLRRDELLAYFDRTAAAAWEALTSDAPVSRVRATVRAGRDAMRARLMKMLPADLRGCTLLDAGCGTGALAVEAAARGSRVTAIDVSARLVETAQRRLSQPSPRTGSGVHGSANSPGAGPAGQWTPEPVRGDVGGGNGILTWHVGDMLSPDLGRFDHVVAMDSLIHYRAADIVAALAGLAERTEQSIVFTVAPSTPLLAIMHAVGRLFPRGDRAPAIQPVASERLARLIAAEPRLAGWHLSSPARITSGFYLSEAYLLARR